MNLSRRSLFAMLFAAPLVKLLPKAKLRKEWYSEMWPKTSMWSVASTRGEILYAFDDGWNKRRFAALRDGSQLSLW